MNIFTHLAIAVRIKHAVEDMLPVKLKTLDFLYGSIKPDISRSFNSIPHFRNASQDFVREEIRNLLKTGYPIYTECTDTFSERLGILTHYLSDFFCYAHSENYSGGLWEHNAYEVKLSMYCNMSFRKLFCLQHDGIMSIKQSQTAICGFLDDLHNEYASLGREPSPASDITFAYEACFAMCYSVLTACLATNYNGLLRLKEAMI